MPTAAITALLSPAVTPRCPIFLMDLLAASTLVAVAERTQHIPSMPWWGCQEKIPLDHGGG